MKTPQYLLGPKTTAPRVFFRFLMGRPLDGIRRSDATFWSRGRQYTSPGWHTRWHLLPGWVVLAVRLVAIYTAVTVLKGWVQDPAAFGATVQAAAEFTHAALWWLVSLWQSPLATLAALGMAVRLVALVLVVVVVRKVRAWRHDREIVHPLARAIAGPLGYSTDAPHRPWLRVPRVLVPAPPLAIRTATGRAWQRFVTWVEGTDGDPAAGIPPRHTGAGWRRLERVIARVHLPLWWVAFRSWLAMRLLPVQTWRVAHARVRVVIPHELGAVGAETRAAVMSAVGVKLPAPTGQAEGDQAREWSASWELSGSRPRLILVPKQYPPTRVLFRDVVGVLERALPNDLLIGLSVGRVPTWWDPDQDSPHAMLSMGSGAGKSVLVRALACQALRKGWAVVLLDFKQDHYWAADLIDRGVPGLFYFRKVPEIHEAFVKLEIVRAFRSDVDFEHRGRMPMQRVLVIAEEMNATVNELRQFWTATRQKSDPRKSPALSALGSLSNAGRSACIHLVVIGQYLTAQVFGGPEARESFGMRALGRYTPAAWRTLVPEFQYVRKSSIRGRVQVCQSDERRETQVPLLTHDEAAEWARGGLSGVIPAGMLPFSWETTIALPDAPARPDLKLVPAQPEAPAAEARTLIGLSVACAPGGPLDGMKLSNARKARQRDKTFPKPAPELGRNGEHLFSRAELGDWMAARANRHEIDQGGGYVDQDQDQGDGAKGADLPGSADD